MALRSKIGFATFSLEQLALGLLMRGPAHGYELYRAYEAEFLPIWKVGRSKFYAALASLSEAGYLTVETELQEERPPRKIYQLTQAGQQRFDVWLHQPVTPVRAIRVEFLAKLRFIEQLQLVDADQIIDGQIAACQAAVDELARHSTDTDDESDPVLDLVHDFRRRQAMFIIEWLEVCRARLTQHADT